MLTVSPYSFRSSPTIPPPVSPLSTPITHHRSISASLSSIIGFKHTSAARRRSSQVSDDDEAVAGNWVQEAHGNGQISPGFLDPVAELESPPPGGILVRGSLNDIVYYEVEGSSPDFGPREMVS
jgi:hypothetical protein